MSDIITPLEMPSNPFEPGLIELSLRALELSEEGGAWDRIECALDCSIFVWIRKFGNDALKARIHEWHAKLAKAREYEAVHGRGSLYIPEHPTNIIVEKIMRDYREITQVPRAL